MPNIKTIEKVDKVIHWIVIFSTVLKMPLRGYKATYPYIKFIIIKNYFNFEIVKFNLGYTEGW